MAYDPRLEEYRKQFKRPDETEPAACTKCGWAGQILDTESREYDSGAESWRKRAGRMGLHYHCPTCDHVVRVYYSVIS